MTSTRTQTDFSETVTALRDRTRRSVTSALTILSQSAWNNMDPAIVIRHLT